MTQVQVLWFTVEGWSLYLLIAIVAFGPRMPEQDGKLKDECKNQGD
jgi:hypothetical protein